MTKTSHDCIGLIGVSACVALLMLSLPGCGEETTSEESPQTPDSGYIYDTDDTPDSGHHVPDSGTIPEDIPDSGEESDSGAPPDDICESCGIVVSKQSLKLLSASGVQEDSFMVSLDYPNIDPVEISLRLLNENAGTLSADKLTFSTGWDWAEEKEVIVRGNFGEKTLSTSIELTVTNSARDYFGKTATVDVRVCAAGLHDNGSGQCVACAEDETFLGGQCRKGFVFIPSGSFESTAAQQTISMNSFFIAKTETTVAEFKKCVDAGACPAGSYRTNEYSRFCNYESDRDPSIYPMNGLYWSGADSYCKWIGGRLPTEDEWEYAATHDGKQARQTKYPWGDEEPTQCEHANYSDYLSHEFCDGRNIKTAEFGAAPVGTYSPEGDSPLGLQEMSGNVGEWTSSQGYGGNYYSKGGSFASDSVSSLSVSSRLLVEYGGCSMGVRCVIDQGY